MRSVHRERLGEVLSRSVAHALRDAAQVVDVIEVTGGRVGDPANTHARACERLRESLLAQITVLEAFALTDRERVTPLAVADVVEIAERLARRAIGLTPITMTIQVPRTLAPTIGIATDMAEAIYAVLMNAIHALRTQGGGSIEVTGILVGDAIAVRIHDDGPGVSEVLRQGGQLFELYTPAAMPISTRGIGLPVARSLVRRHGGDLLLEPEDPAGGATFTLVLPLWRRSAEALVGRRA